MTPQSIADLSAYRDGILAMLAGERASEWRHGFEERPAVLEHDGGTTRDEAERAAYLDALVDLVEGDADLCLLRSSIAEPLERHALAELGLLDPRADAR